MVKMGLGYQELLLVLVVMLFLFGGKRLPDLASGLGMSIRAFKRGVGEGEFEDAQRPREAEKLQPRAGAEGDRQMSPDLPSANRV